MYRHFIAGLALALSIPAVSKEAPRAVLIEHVNVITADRAAPLRNASVLIVDGRIAVIRRLKKVFAPHGAQRIEGAGRWLVAGFRDVQGYGTDAQWLAKVADGGRLAAGMPADVVFLEQDPFSADAAGPRISGVIADGRYLPRAALRQLAATPR